MRTIHSLFFAALVLVPTTSLAGEDEKEATPSAEGFGDNKEADLTKREKNGLGGHWGRLFLYGFTASGEDFTRQPTTTPANGTTPATTTTPSKDYSRLGAAIEFSANHNNDKTRFKTLLGFDFNAAFGYATLSYADNVAPKNDDGSDHTGSLFLRTEGGPSFGLIDFGGEHTGVRLTFFPAMGLYLDGGRFYDSYAYFSLGGRISAHLGEKTDAHLQYIFVPGTTAGDYRIREHRTELSANFGPVAVGARFQLDTVEGQPTTVTVPATPTTPASSTTSTPSSKNATFGALVGLAFE